MKCHRMEFVWVTELRGVGEKLDNPQNVFTEIIEIEVWEVHHKSVLWNDNTDDNFVIYWFLTKLVRSRENQLYKEVDKQKTSFFEKNVGYQDFSPHPSFV